MFRFVVDEFLKFANGFLCTFFAVFDMDTSSSFLEAFRVLTKSSSQVLCGVFEGGGGRI